MSEPPGIAQIGCATLARVPVHAWQRPVDFDLVHLGLISAADIPGLSMRGRTY